ncbi:Crp/Fnr family transcriptional regulator [Altererythrobacter sp. TH136]|uniref:Crp/Fnr family transcriptional regulator n=1 Tax=Altererythrobacter sp. TH136 TaxID=2067415 RepID=UPI001162FBED|nr:Crp/Fnr family transcriptional regulator [Altererythrobacter sp. TH136]QDM41387.1 Crp/Fnr family transcriptional regulator [Altererythrobacter sp. TH136]
MVEEAQRYPLTGRFLMGRSRHAMSEADKQLLEDSVCEVGEYDRPHRILARGELAHRSAILIEGFMLRTIYEGDRRHIVGIHVPGDFVDLHAYALKRLDHDVISVGPSRIGYVTHERIGLILENEAHLARLFWFSTLLDAAIHRQWTLKLEQLKASRRVAHRLSEIWNRLEMVGLGRANGFRSPLTQTDLADMCGTTPIHMNRALSELRREEVVEFRRGLVVVRDRTRLEKFGDFDPAYLYGEGPLHLQSEHDNLAG